MSFPSATIIADSISPEGIRVTTMELHFHRFIAEEVLTYRKGISRNAASSRAMPTKKRIQAVLDDPAIPLEWHYNQPGMQGTKSLSANDREIALGMWLDARDDAVNAAERMMWIGPTSEKTGEPVGVHKQIVNRLLHPFMKHKMIFTATDWGNILSQRDHRDAQPEFRALAKEIRKALEYSNPVPLRYEDFHHPYMGLEDSKWIYNEGLSDQYTEIANALCVARCARVSYLNHDGKRNPVKDIQLYNQLLGSDPPHLSPFEHVCKPTPFGAEWQGSFFRWDQLRHLKPQRIVL